jgi:hypothetical protein
MKEITADGQVIINTLRDYIEHDAELRSLEVSLHRNIYRQATRISDLLEIVQRIQPELNLIDLEAARRLDDFLMLKWGLLSITLSVLEGGQMPLRVRHDGDIADIQHPGIGPRIRADPVNMNLSFIVIGDTIHKESYKPDRQALADYWETGAPITQLQELNRSINEIKSVLDEYFEFSEILLELNRRH